MATQERIAWIVLAGALAALGYFAFALGQGDGPMLGRALHRTLVMGVVIWSAVAFMTYVGTPAWEDERDAAIRHRAGGIAYGFVLAALVVGALALGYGQNAWLEPLTPVLLSNLAMALLLATAALQALVQVVMYRRDAA
jgi:hypothetical protein